MNKKKMALRICIFFSILVGLILIFLSKEINVLETITTFTVISNFLTLVFYSFYIFKTKENKDDNYHAWIFYVCMMALVLTFLIANTLLVDLYFTGNIIFSIALILLHIVSPILVVCDYIATDSIHDIKIHYFITGILPTLLYTVTIVTLQLINTNYTPSYFFFDVSSQGLLGVIRNLTLISLVFTPISFVLCKIKQNKKN